MLITALVFLLLLSVLVLIHELGHFLVAKKFGIKVEEFGWGFPPKIWGKKIGETEYTINLLPIGGFVKLYGEDEAGGGRVKIPNSKSEIRKDLKRAYFSKPAWQRALVVLAGVVMNIFLAFAIFYVYFFISGFKTTMPLLTDHKFTNTNQVNYNINTTDSVVSYVLPKSPAAELEMSTPAEILEINGQMVSSREAFIATVNSNRGKEITFTWKEFMTGEIKTGVATPRVNPPKNEGALGIAFLPVSTLSYDTIGQKALSGVTYSYDLFAYTVSVMKSLITISVESGDPAPVGEAVSGPVGIFNAVGDILQFPNMQERILSLLMLAGAMSVSLAFFNVLPIPALDGGRLFFIVIEMITRKKINQRFEAIAHTVGFALLMGLILLIVFSDIFKLLR
jgi:regulator of sigma E protease